MEMTNEKANETLLHSCGVIYKLLRVLFHVVWIVSLVGLVLIALDALTPLSGLVTNNDLKLGPLEMHLREAYIPPLSSLYLPLAIRILCGGLIGCMILRRLKKVFKPMSEGAAFGGSVSREIKALAWTVLAGGFVSDFVRTFIGWTTLSAYDLSKLLSEEMVSSWTISFDSRLGYVLVFALLWLLSYVFRYGETLQQLSDETL